MKTENSTFERGFSSQYPSSNIIKALELGVEALVSKQAVDGSWEGEVVWCPMLAAQYTLMCYITQTPIAPQRRKMLLLQFAATRLPDGLWGLHSQSKPYLFVTTLVYVAARTLGVPEDDPLLIPAREFIRKQGGVIPIPSWGKFWLAMLNLYDWSGVNPVLPEVWRLPKWIPAHPQNYYCHTRLIYMPMGFIYGCKFQVPITPLIEQLRKELYLSDYRAIAWNQARHALRTEEIYSPPSLILSLAYQISTIYESLHSKKLRESVSAEVIEMIHYELQTTDCKCLSSVSGLLNIIALWIHNAKDANLYQTIERLEGWMWEDEQNGLRIAGARSSTWDTAFAIQSLEAVKPYVEVSDNLLKGQMFLGTQQIRAPFPNFERFHRTNPQGGFCFAGVWHGWPVSDCTAEALMAMLDAPSTALNRGNLLDAVKFILRCQNADGGFGSFERRRIASNLEWLNPAEMFANSMTEHSYVECTASCLEALREWQAHYPEVMVLEINAAIERGGLWLLSQQRSDGSWPGFWGVNFIYGTMFGIRGLLAGRIPPNSPAIGRAARWLVSKQRMDGGWGEHFQGCLTGEYTEHGASQVIQTAWAMMGLLAVGTEPWEAIAKGANFLVKMQLENGEWPQQDWAGVFFQTALLDYTLYRYYFPLWALGLYESRRLEGVEIEN